METRQGKPLGETSEKYREAVSLYATTDEPMKRIAARCGVTAGGLRAYLRRHHRDLVLARYDIPAAADQQPAELSTVNSQLSTGRALIRSPKGQTPAARQKYKAAIEACDNPDYIHYNISQIAAEFKVDGVGLANQLRLHYPDVIDRRDRERARLGIGSNIHRGLRPDSKERYAAAVELYATSTLSMPQVAAKCEVSLGGLSQHLRFYHKELLAQKESLRKAATLTHRNESASPIYNNVKEAPSADNCQLSTVHCQLSGNGRPHAPAPSTVARYAAALELYRTTDCTASAAAKRTGVPYEGFRGYLRAWHPDVRPESRGYGRASTRYTPVIADLRKRPRAIGKAASEYGLNPDNLRRYIAKHEPELFAALSCERRYAEAIRLYETTAEPLKHIAIRLGLVYASLCGYVRRHRPEARGLHEETVRRMNDTNNIKNERI